MQEHRVQGSLRALGNRGMDGWGLANNIEVIL